MHYSRRFLMRSAIQVGVIAVAGVSSTRLMAAEPSSPGTLSRDSVLRDPEIPAMGNPDGDVTIVEYFDYQCPYCKKVHLDLSKIVREDNNVRLVLKNWPVIGGDESVFAAKMALAAKYQGKYAEAHEALITARSRLTQSRVSDLLKKAGLDIAALSDDLQANADGIDATLARNNAQAEAFGFQGTPAFIIGSFRVPSVLNLAGFKHVIKDVRASQKKAELADVLKTGRELQPWRESDLNDAWTRPEVPSAGAKSPNYRSGPIFEFSRVCLLCFQVGAGIYDEHRRLRGVCTENLIRVDDVMESPKLAE